MDKIEKSFPDVKTLVIDSTVGLIKIPNTLFPNVKKVKSNSRAFAFSDECLVYNGSDSMYITLFNTFCKNKDEEIDLTNIQQIADKAFYKCQSLNIKNTEMLSFFKDLAFEGSALSQQPFMNGVKLMNDIVIEVDESAEEVILPDEDEPIRRFADNVNLSKVKKLIIHNAKSLRYLNTIAMPPVLVLDSDKFTKSSIEIVAHMFRNQTYVQQLKLTDKVKDFKEIDGIVYNNSMTELIACSIDKESVEIPEGIVTISRGAFKYCKIKTIKLPDSLETIEEYAFSYCHKLRHIDFGKSLYLIGNKAFLECTALEEVEFPEQLKVIKASAFLNSGLESIKLNEGLQRIGLWAFANTNITSVDIPASVNEIGPRAFGIKLKSLEFEKFSPVYFFEIIDGAMDDEVIEVKCQDKIAYIPRYIKPSMEKKFQESFIWYFNQDLEKTWEFWDYAYLASGRENAAFVEYEAFAGYRAEAYLKKNAKRFAFRLIKEGDEEKTVRFLKLGFLSNASLKELASKANELGQMTVQAYLLELLRGERNHDFSL